MLSQILLLHTAWIIRCNFFQQEEMQKQIVAQIQHQQKLAEMTPEQRLAHQASEWSSNIPVPPASTAATSETTQTSTSTASSVPTGYPNANGEYTTYRKCFLLSVYTDIDSANKGNWQNCGALVCRPLLNL